jgi:hypothetical protein
MTRWILALVLVACTGCRSTDQFNRLAAQLTSDAITASEQHRCTVHGMPCLTDDQFKAVNGHLNKVSVAGEEYTKLRIAGTASVKDASTFLSTVATETGILAQTYTDGAIWAVLAKLTALQQKAVTLIGGTK